MPDGRKDEGLDRWAEDCSLVAHSSKSKTIHGKWDEINHKQSSHLSFIHLYFSQFHLQHITCKATAVYYYLIMLPLYYDLQKVLQAVYSSRFNPSALIYVQCHHIWHSLFITKWYTSIQSQALVLIRDLEPSENVFEKLQWKAQTTPNSCDQSDTKRKQLIGEMEK